MPKIRGFSLREFWRRRGRQFNIHTSEKKITEEERMWISKRRGLGKIMATILGKISTELGIIIRTPGRQS